MPDQPDALMLFAAGFGTRMGALTRAQPKPLIKVAGKPLIAHALAQGEGVVLRTRLANLHYKPEALRAWLDAQGVQTVTEAPDILETGGGLKAALAILGQGPVFTLNTDAIWNGPAALRILAEAWEPARMDALLLTIPLDQAVAHGGDGDFTLAPDGTLSRGGPEVYTGAQIIKTGRLAEIDAPAFSLNILWEMMRAEGRLFGTRYPGRWCDVGHPDGIAAAENMLGYRSV